MTQATDQDTIYQLDEVGTDFDTNGFEVRLERPAFTPGSRGTLRRLLFVDADFDPDITRSELVMETLVDGRDETRKTKIVSVAGDGTVGRRKVFWKRLGRWFWLNYSFSTGTGSVDQVGDSAGDTVGDSAGNILGGKGETVRRFRFLGHTFGVQGLGSKRR